MNPDRSASRSARGPSSADALALMRNTRPDGSVDALGYEADRMVMHHQIVGGTDVDAVVRDMVDSPQYRDAQGRIQAAPLVEAIGARLAAPDLRRFDQALDRAGIDQGWLDKAGDAVNRAGQTIGDGIAHADRQASDFLANARNRFHTLVPDPQAPAWAREWAQSASQTGNKVLGDLQEQYGIQKGSLQHAYKAVEGAVDTVALAGRFATDPAVRDLVLGTAKAYAAATLDDPAKPLNDLRRAATDALERWDQGLQTARAQGKERQYMGETQGAIGFEAAMLIIPVGSLGKLGQSAKVLQRGARVGEGLAEAAELAGDAMRTARQGGTAGRMAGSAVDDLVSAYRTGGKLDEFVQATRAAGHLDELLSSGRLTPKEVTTLAVREPGAFAQVPFDTAWEASLRNVGPVAKLTARQTGEIAEAVIARDLIRQGYTDIASIQNKSGWGVDIGGRSPASGQFEFLEVKGSRIGKAKGQAGEPEEKIRDWLNRAATGDGHWAPHNMAPGMREVAQALLNEIEANGGKLNAQWARVNLSNDARTGELLIDKTIEPWLSPAQRGVTPRGPSGPRASIDETDPHAELGPRKARPTGDPTFDAAFFALQSGDEVAIQEALRRVMQTPETQAMLQRGREIVEAQQMREAQALATQAEVFPDLPITAAPAIETRRGPVMMMTLLNKPPVDAGGGNGAGGGGGDGGGGGGGGGGG